MANRFPLIVDSSALQIKELPASDNLDLANSSIVNATSLTATSLTIVDSTVTGGINASGVITASSFSGNGSGLTGVASTENIITGTAATFTGGITANEIDVTGNMTVGGVLTYEDVTNIDSVGMVTARIGVRVLAGGINAVGVVTATGICTITVTGGTEADSHTVRIVNSGIATVGFSTYFLFPSGAAPSLPTASGAISLISFTIHRQGRVGVDSTFLAGSSVNFS